MFKVKTKQTFLQQLHVPFMCIYFVATKKHPFDTCLSFKIEGFMFVFVYCYSISFTLSYTFKKCSLTFFKVIVILVVHLFEQHQQTTSIIIRKEKKEGKIWCLLTNDHHHYVLVVLSFSSHVIFLLPFVSFSLWKSSAVVV